MLQSPFGGFAAEFLFFKLAEVLLISLDFPGFSEQFFLDLSPWKSPPIYRLLVAIRRVYEHLIH